MTAFEVVLRALLVGVGGTAVLDLWAAALQRFAGMPATNWGMVGRWIGRMREGRFSHTAMAQVAPVRGERAIGWTAHYLIGAAYGVLLVALTGADWLAAPTLLPALLLSWALLVAPFFLMMPGMGMGVAGARTPKPHVTRLKSVVGHSIFALGMVGTAWAMSLAEPAS